MFIFHWGFVFISFVKFDNFFSKDSLTKREGAASVRQKHAPQDRARDAESVKVEWTAQAELFGQLLSILLLMQDE